MFYFFVFSFLTDALFPLGFHLELGQYRSSVVYVVFATCRKMDEFMLVASL